MDTQSYAPDKGAVYPDSTYGRQLRQTAQLIKDGVGLEIATIDFGGWDTHSAQGGGEPEGALSKKLKAFADGIAALYTDLGSAMNDVVILTMTEFGRTAAENGSKGTDHGNASCWFAVGRSISGGMHGDWPGLAPSQLYRDRYLAHSLDFRDILGELLVGHLQSSDPEYVLPGHVLRPVGLL